VQDIIEVMREALGNFKDAVAHSSGSENEESDGWDSDSFA
jgi:hypothetical protein